MSEKCPTCGGPAFFIQPDPRSVTRFAPFWKHDDKAETVLITIRAALGEEKP